MKYAKNVNAREMVSKMLRGSLMLGFAGFALSAGTACELVGPIVEDGLVDSVKPPPPPPQDERSPECDKATQRYVEVLTRQVSFPDDASFVRALEERYAAAVAVCGEGVVPPPPPIDLGSGGKGGYDGAGARGGDGSGARGGGGEGGRGGEGGGGEGGRGGEGGQGGDGGRGGDDGNGGRGGDDGSDDELSPECQKAFDAYVQSLRAPTDTEGRDIRQVWDRLYTRAVDACGEGVVPPPPAI